MSTRWQMTMSCSLFIIRINRYENSCLNQGNQSIEGVGDGYGHLTKMDTDGHWPSWHSQDGPLGHPRLDPRLKIIKFCIPISWICNRKSRSKFLFDKMADDTEHDLQEHAWSNKARKCLEKDAEQDSSWPWIISCRHLKRLNNNPEVLEQPKQEEFELNVLSKSMQRSHSGLCFCSDNCHIRDALNSRLITIIGITDCCSFFETCIFAVFG